MSDYSRRKLLKTIAAGSGAVIAGKSLPDNWTKPVVDSVVLPAHAQTSVTQAFTYQQTQANTDVCSGRTSGIVDNPVDLVFDVSTATPTGLGTLETTAIGDLNNTGEGYTIYVGGVQVGQTSDGTGGPATVNDTFTNIDVASAISGGTVTVRFVPNSTTNALLYPNCNGTYANSVSATLSFPATGTP